jgi:hypothetical protein
MEYFRLFKLQPLDRRNYFAGLIGVLAGSIFGFLGFFGFFFSFLPLSLDLAMINLLKLIHHFNRQIPSRSKYMIANEKASFAAPPGYTGILIKGFVGVKFNKLQGQVLSFYGDFLFALSASLIESSSRAKTTA